MIDDVSKYISITPFFTPVHWKIGVSILIPELGKCGRSNFEIELDPTFSSQEATLLGHVAGVAVAKQILAIIG